MGAEPNRTKIQYDMNYTTKPAQRKPPHNDTRRIALNEPWTAVPNRLLQDARLSRSARLLYCVLLMFAGNSGEAFPSQRRLAQALGRMAANGATARPASLRSVQRWLHELRVAGWLTWRRSSSGGNVYTLATASDAGDAPPAAGDPPHRVNLGEAWTAVPNRLLTDARLTRGARLLACMLFMHADKSGQAFPSQRRLARLAGWRRAPDAAEGADARPTTLRSVQRWLHELRAAGWLTWQRTRRTNLYTMTAPPARDDAVPATNTAPPDDQRKEKPGHGTAGAARAPPAAPDSSNDATETQRFLEGLGVLCAREFAHLPLHAVQRRVEQLRRTERLRCDPDRLLGALVLSLRANPPQEDDESPARCGEIDPKRYVNGAYGDLFRLGSDTSDLENASPVTDASPVASAAPPVTDASPVASAAAPPAAASPQFSLTGETEGGTSPAPSAAPHKPTFFLRPRKGAQIERPYRRFRS